MVASKNCPFQFDLTIAVGKMMELDSISGDDFFADDSDEDDEDDEDDDSDNVDEFERFRDVTIASRLDAMSLENISIERDTTNGVDKVFDVLHQQFGKEKDLKNRRLISVVDRRVQCGHLDPNKNDIIYLYQPPKDKGRYIPKEDVPLWHFDSSIACLMPGEVDKCVIGAKSARGYGGGLLTFSIHAKRKRVTKLYMYFGGGCMRLMSKDIINVLPIFFNMEYGNNTEWIHNENVVNAYTERMKQCLVDEEFKAFQQSYK